MAKAAARTKEDTLQREEQLKKWMRENKKARACTWLAKVSYRVALGRAIRIFRLKSQRGIKLEREVRAFLGSLPADMSPYGQLLIREGFDTLEAMALLEVHELQALGLKLGHCKVLYSLTTLQT